MKLSDRLVIKTDAQRVATAGILLRQAFEALGGKENLELHAIVFNLNNPSDETAFHSTGSLIGQNYMVNLLLHEMKLPSSALEAIRTLVSEAVTLKGLEYAEAHSKSIGHEMPADMAQSLAKLRAKYPNIEEPNVNDTGVGAGEQTSVEGAQAVDDVLQPVHEADTVQAQEHDHARGDGERADVHEHGGFDSVSGDGGGAGSTGE